jgi:diguanylate cyclase (GGDEF)-like protein
LSKRERIARVSANERTRVLELHWDAIRQLARFRPRVSMVLYRNLAEVMGRRLVEQSEDPARVNDELTGALTRPYLCEILSHEIRNSQHFDQPLSLMLLDVDTTAVNDLERAADVDDVMMLGVARIIQKYTRATDVLARWEHNRFMIVLPRTEVAEALQLAGNLEQNIQQLELSPGAYLHINTAVTTIRHEDRREDVINRLENQLSSFKQKSLRVSVV